MKILMIYPPGAYPYMPYLAPYLIKGYIEEQSDHEVQILDLNLLYHRHLWSAEFSSSAQKVFEAAHNEPLALVAEMVANHVDKSWSALRNFDTYENFLDVRKHFEILKLSTRLVPFVNKHLGCPSGILPHNSGEWSTLSVHHQSGVTHHFIHQVLSGERLSEFGAIGFCAAYLPQMLPTFQCAQLIRSLHKQVPLIIGGGALTHLFEDLKKDSSFWECFDFAIPFEGEHILLELLNSIEHGSEFPQYNLARCVMGAPSYVQDFSRKPKTQPVPDFDGMLNLFPTPEPVYPLLTSKGCYWGKCAFCTHHEGYGQGFYPFKDHIFEESIRRLTAKGVRHFYFVDEALPPKRIKAFAELFQRYKSLEEEQPVAWMAEARLDKTIVNSQFVKLLEESGCRFMVSGIESGAPSVIKRMDKGMDLEIIAEFARLAKNTSIHIGWMFFIGFPGEKEPERLQTFDFIAQNYDLIDYASVGTFSLERGSPIWNAPGQHGISKIQQEGTYILSYDYLMDGVMHSESDLAEGLVELHKKFPQLDPLFSRAIDRSMVLFMRERPKNLTASQTTPSAIRWFSNKLQRHLQFNSENMHITDAIR